jgi:hypothetical protein
LGSTSLRYTACGFSRVLRVPDRTGEARFFSRPLVLLVRRTRVIIAATRKRTLIESMRSRPDYE